MMKKILLGLFVLIVVIGVIIGVGWWRFFGAVDFEPGHPKTSEMQTEDALMYKIMQLQVWELNQQLPTMRDEITRAEKVTLGPGLQVVNHLTLVDYSPSDSENASHKANTIKGVCSDKDLKESLQYGVKYIYAYSGEDTEEILRIEVDADICGYPKELAMYKD